MKTKMMLCLVALVALLGLTACDENPPKPSADRQQQAQQERLAQEGQREVGMPNITNFTERKLLKQIYELRDQANLSTYSYIFSAITGKYTFIGNSIGFPVSAATQYTNPEKIVRFSYGGSYRTEKLPQADPNLNFSPSSTEGSWVLLVNSKTGKAEPSYFEDRITCLTFPLPDRLVVH